MNRLEVLRQVIDDIIWQNPDPGERRAGFIHLYGVSAICVILGLRRGLELELCAVAGMLHDIWNDKVGDTLEHGRLGAEEAKKILQVQGDFTTSEIETICTAIARHSDKASIDGEMDELLKDADVFQHYLYNPTLFMQTAAVKPLRLQRLEHVLAELGIPLLNHPG